MGRRSRFRLRAGVARFLPTADSGALAAACSRAKADALETKIRVQYDAPSEDTVRATVAVEWTREITVKARGGS